MEVDAFNRMHMLKSPINAFQSEKRFQSLLKKQNKYYQDHGLKKPLDNEISDKVEYDNQKYDKTPLTQSLIYDEKADRAKRYQGELELAQKAYDAIMKR